jgi:hypothetical protein
VTEVLSHMCIPLSISLCAQASFRPFAGNGDHGLLIMASNADKDSVQCRKRGRSRMLPRRDQSTKQA